MLEFAQPAMLWALGAVSAPIIIHLLSRRRYRRTPWAATAFLLVAQRVRRRLVVLEKLLLLALRVIAVGLLVVLFARPFLSRSLPGIGALGEGGTTVLALLDDSASMSQRTGDGTAFRRATRLLSALASDLAEAAAPISLTVYVAGRPEALFHADHLSHADADGLSAMLHEAAPSAVSLSAEGELAELARRAEASKARNVTFLVLTDLRAFDWAEPEAPGTLRRSVAEALRRLQGRGQVVLADTAPEDTDNVGLAGVRFAEPLLYGGQASSCRVTLENRSAGEFPPGTLHVLADGNSLPPVPTPSVAPGAGRETLVSLSLEAGHHGLEVRIDADDSFPADDRAYLAAHSRRSVRVLIVQGPPSPGKALPPGYYLEAALQPEPGRTGGVQVEVRAPWALRELALSDYAAVFLCNVPDPGDPAALRRFVEAGGGLVIFAGGGLDRDRWNASLLDPQRGVLPARLTQAVQLSGDAPARLGAFDFDSPLLAPFERWESLLGMVLVEGFWGLEPLGDTHVTVRYDDNGGSPALLVRTLGRGSVLMFTTSADDEWNDWARSEVGRITFVPLMHRAVEQMATAASTDLNLTAGSPLVMKLDLSRHTRTALLHPPASEAGPPPAPASLRAETREGREGLWLAGEPLRQAGLWRLELTKLTGGTDTVYFAVNIAPGERRLERVPARAFEAAAERPDSLRVLRGKQVRAADAAGPRRQYTGALAALLLALLLVESVLAHRFGNPRATGSE